VHEADASSVDSPLSCPLQLLGTQEQAQSLDKKASNILAQEPKNVKHPPEKHDEMLQRAKVLRERVAALLRRQEASGHNEEQKQLIDSIQETLKQLEKQFGVELSLPVAA